jgi:hypothetical protein
MKYPASSTGKWQTLASRLNSRQKRRDMFYI